MTVIAFAPAIRGNDSGRWMQDRSLAAIAHVAMESQRAWLHNQLWPRADMDDSSYQIVPAPDPTVNVITWQWDETTQRIKGMLSRLAPGEKLSHSKVSTQIMMQGGSSACIRSAEGCYALNRASHGFVED